MAERAEKKLPGVVMLLYKNSAVAGGIAKKLAQLGYEVSTKVNDFADLCGAKDNAVFIMYLPAKMVEDPQSIEILSGVCDQVSENSRKMILIGDAAYKAQLIEALPAAVRFAWLDRPVDMDSLDGLLKEDGGQNGIKRILIIDEVPLRARELRAELKEAGFRRAAEFTWTKHVERIIHAVESSRS